MPGKHHISCLPLPKFGIQSKCVSLCFFFIFWKIRPWWQELDTGTLTGICDEVWGLTLLPQWRGVLEISSKHISINLAVITEKKYEWKNFRSFLVIKKDKDKIFVIHKRSKSKFLDFSQKSNFLHCIKIYRKLTFPPQQSR